VTYVCLNPSDRTRIFKLNSLFLPVNLQSISASNRPRERLEKSGLSSLSDSELLAIILGTGTRKKNVIDLANSVLLRHSLPDLSRASIAELTNISGIGKIKASQIIAGFELSRRALSGAQAEKSVFNSAEDVAQVYMPRLEYMKTEQVIAVYLNIRRRMISESIISSGTGTVSIISPKDIFQTALVQGAAAVILIHNHPSGDPSPSDEDISVTNDLAAAGQLLGIKLLDHIIIGNNKYVSLRDKSQIE
jgi:DNA repair protein RadC